MAEQRECLHVSTAPPPPPSPPIVAGAAVEEETQPREPVGRWAYTAVWGVRRALSDLCRVAPPDRAPMPH